MGLVGSCRPIQGVLLFTLSEMGGCGPEKGHDLNYMLKGLLDYYVENRFQGAEMEAGRPVRRLSQ